MSKLRFITEQLIEANNLLFNSIKTLYKEDDKNSGKLYHPISVMLLSFCFIDCLRRLNYIFENGKDGKENFNNKINYEDFLNRFIINNDKYNQYNYSFDANSLYQIRNDLVHSFGLKRIYNNDIFNFVGGDLFESKKNVEDLNILGKLNNPLARNIHTITFKSFLEIIKEGMMKMLREWEKKTLKDKDSESFKKNINDLHLDLKDITYFYLGSRLKNKVE